MFLSDQTIARLIDAGRIVILPDFDRADIKPAGIRLHLGEEILVPKPGAPVALDGGRADFEPRRLPPEGLVLRPHDFILAATRERFQVPRDILPMLDGKSGVARLGLTVHVTAAACDGNYEEPRTVTLEICNHGPFEIVIKPGAVIAQLLFAQLSAPIVQGATTKYATDEAVSPPNLG